MSSNPLDKENYSPFLSENERKSCCEDVEQDNCNSTEKNCIDSWKKKRIDARQHSEKALASLQSANDLYASALSWESKLKKWKEDAEEAHSKAVTTYNGIEEFLNVIARIKTDKTIITTQAVLCLVKSIFERVSTMLFVSTSCEDDLGQIQALRQRIECSEKLDAERKNKALECILPFEEKVKVVQGLEVELLNNLLLIVYQSNQVAAAVDFPEADENLGIKWQLEDLKDRISGQKMYTKRERKCGNQQSKGNAISNNQDSNSGELPCSSDVMFPEKTYFPILKMEDITNSKNSDYYEKISDLYEKAITTTAATKVEAEKRKKLSEEALAYYNGLNDAIQAVEAAKTA